VRLVDLGRGAPTAARRWLTPTELAYADQGTPAVRDRRVLLRAAVRSVLGESLGLDPAAVRLLPPPGRPGPVGLSPDGTWLDVSCSASAGLGVVAVAHGARVGVDVERVRPGTLEEAVAEGWLADPEVVAVAHLPAAARPAALTRCWTQKEAVLKAVGTGLRADPRTVVTRIGHSCGTIGRWSVTSVDVADGWAASVALGPPPPPVPVPRRRELMPRRRGSA
jgi:4'-phosphopantetheinyl transferase